MRERLNPDDGSGTGMEMMLVRPSPRLTDQIAVIRRRKWWIVAFVLCAVFMAGALAVSSPPQYGSTVALLARPSITSTQSISNAGPNLVNIATEQSLVKSTSVALVAKTIMGSALSADSLLRHVSVSSPTGTEVLDITFSDPDPRTAKVGASAFARAYIRLKSSQVLQAKALIQSRLEDEAKSLTTQLTNAGQELARSLPGSLQHAAALTSQQLLKAQLVAVETRLAALSAIAPTPGTTVSGPTLPHRSSRNQMAMVLGSVFAGLCLGLLAAFSRDALDGKLRDAGEVAAAVGLPVLATIPRQKGGSRRTRELATVDEPHGAAADGFRALRAPLARLAGERGVRTFLFTSAVPDASVSDVVGNAAIASAQAHRPVTVISADLRDPRLEDLLGVSREPGLSDVLAGRTELSDAVATSDDGLIRCLPSGSDPQSAVDLLFAPEMEALLSRVASQRMDTVLVAGSATTHPDSLALTALVDATILVVEWGSASAQDLQRSRSALEDAGGVVVGTVFEDRARRARRARSARGARLPARRAAEPEPAPPPWEHPEQRGSGSPGRGAPGEVNGSPAPDVAVRSERTGGSIDAPSPDDGQPAPVDTTRPRSPRRSARPKRGEAQRVSDPA